MVKKTRRAASKRLDVRITEDEMRKLQREAESTGLSISLVVRCHLWELSIYDADSVLSVMKGRTMP